MQYRVLGRTGLKVSALGFGGMRFGMVGDHVDEGLAVASLHRAMDLGVNYIDSAVGYCMPCPNGVNIPECFRLTNLHRVYGLTESARERYAWPGKEGNLNAGACVECGQCEPKCPQKIPIVDQLKETHQALGG